METRQDLYSVLELDKNATDAQIKASYKKLVKKWHPDKNQDNVEEATKKFREISDAFNILGDPDKRKTYDEFGFNGFNNENDANGANPFGFDPFSMFSSFFQKENDVPEIHVPVEVSLEELYTGIKKKVQYERYTLCKNCDAKGRLGTNVDCKKCDGRGMTVQKTSVAVMQSTCRDCNGKGVNLKAPKCKSCDGNGCIKENHTVTVNIPKGSSDKHPIMIENEGNEIPKNEQTDDSTRSTVVIVVVEMQHDTYKRGTVIKEIGKVNENNLLTEINLTLEESLCGFERKLTHLDGKQFTFSMTDSVRHEDIFVMKGLGMPHFDKNEKGDMIIKVHVDKANLTNEQKHSIWKILSSKPYTEIKKKSKVLNFEEYKTESIHEHKKENMKNKYKKREFDGENMTFNMGHNMAQNMAQNINGCPTQ